MSEAIRIGVTADSHLGRRYPTMEFREGDINAGFDIFLDSMLGQGPDLVIHAGDLFDSVFPPGWIFERGLSGIQAIPQGQEGCQVSEEISGQRDAPNVFVVHGNHDGTADARCESGCFSVLKYFDSMSLCNYLDARRVDESVYFPRYVCEKGGVKVGIQGLGHRSPSQFEKLFSELRPIEGVHHNILVIHQGLAELTTPYTRGDILPPELFRRKGFDLVIAGHTHRPFYQEYEDTKFLIPGSSERIDSGEFGERKGYYILELTREDLVPDFRVVDLDQNRKIRRYEMDVDGLSGSEITEQCLQAVVEPDISGALIYFVLRGQTPHGHNDVDRAAMEASLTERGATAAKFNTEKVVRKEIGELVHNGDWRSVRISPETFRRLFSERNLRDLAGNPIRDESVISILSQIAYNVYRAFERDDKEEVQSVLERDLVAVAESFYPAQEDDEL